MRNDEKKYGTSERTNKDDHQEFLRQNLKGKDEHEVDHQRLLAVVEF